MAGGSILDIEKKRERRGKKKKRKDKSIYRIYRRLELLSVLIPSLAKRLCSRQPARYGFDQGNTLIGVITSP